MASATITSKGQVTIPVGVRSDLGLGTGDRIEFVLNETTGRYELVPATKSGPVLNDRSRYKRASPLHRSR
jgi:AbrB family looped-hinge helix DNA binding protein